MRIIIVSDNHGNKNILKILYHIYSSLYKDNVKFIHLGDSQTTSINDLNNFICVKGNNDTLDLPKFQRLTVLDKRIHFSHGDEGLDEIKKDIDQHHPDIYLYGHTHLVKEQIYNNCLILNPGSITLPRDDWHGSYIILTIDKKVTYKVVRINVETFLNQYQCFIE